MTKSGWRIPGAIRECYGVYTVQTTRKAIVRGGRIESLYLISNLTVYEHLGLFAKLITCDNYYRLAFCRILFTPLLLFSSRNGYDEASLYPIPETTTVNTKARLH